MKGETKGGLSELYEVDHEQSVRKNGSSRRLRPMLPWYGHSFVTASAGTRVGARRGASNDGSTVKAKTVETVADPRADFFHKLPRWSDSRCAARPHRFNPHEPRLVTAVSAVLPCVGRSGHLDFDTVVSRQPTQPTLYFYPTRTGNPRAANSSPSLPRSCSRPKPTVIL